MESIRDKVAIIGVGCTKFGENWEQSWQDLIVEAAYEAFEDANIEPKDIQAAWVGSWNPRGCSGRILTEPLKLRYIPATRVENACATGSDTLRNACYAVACGAYDIVLALGFEKLKDSGYSGLPDQDTWQGWDSTFRHATVTGPGRFAMMATGYFAKYHIDPEEGKKVLAQIAVKNHHNGSLNPKAHFRQEITIEQALKAPIVAWPLGLFDCCGVSDGAAAAIVTRAEIAKRFNANPIYVKALQIGVGPGEGFLSSKYDWAHVEETYRTGAAAYAEAGIQNPRKGISIAEVHDCFTITELTIMEDLQFSPRGRAPEDVKAGFFTLEGGLPVNTDGGLKCFGHPLGASGLRMLYELCKQLQGRAGVRQIKNPKIGLTHSMGGTPGSSAVSVVIVGNDLG